MGLSYGKISSDTTNNIALSPAKLVGRFVAKRAVEGVAGPMCELSARVLIDPWTKQLGAYEI